MSSLRAVATLILAITIMQAANGLLGVQLPLAMHDDGLKEAAIGFVAATYSAGFLAGAWFGPRLLARVGHIRVYAASAALTSAATLMLFAANDPISWAVLRLVTGAAVALVFLTVDSWLAAQVRAEERGGAMGVYQVVTKAALVVGPFLAASAPAHSAIPLMVAGALQALAVVPVAMTNQPQPEPPRAAPLALRALFGTAPAAATAAFFAGLINGGVLAHTPVYAGEHHGAAGAQTFYAAAWVGSIILQWPAGKLSDRMDRRLVIAALAGLAALSSFALAVAGEQLALPLAAFVFALWGAGALSFYGIANAHMADRAEPGRLAQATSGLLFLWAAGSIVGPALLGIAVEVAGGGAIFWFGGVTAVVLTAFMFWRRRERPAGAVVSSEAVAPKSATSVAAAELAYGEDK